MSKLRVFTAFSGYDSQMIALKNRLKLDCDLVGWSEIDKYAIEAHNILFPEYSGRNFGDISKINWNKVPDFDLFTYSSPCQDFSTAGQGAGGAKGSGTRSSLLWECERAIKTKKPKYLLFENVPAVLHKGNRKVFEQWCKKLVSLGYINFYKVINATECNVPQSRNRLYMVSILGNAKYTFPAPKKLTKNLEDICEAKVDDKYYINNDGVKWRIQYALKIEKKGFSKPFRVRSKKDIACTLTCSPGDRSSDNYLISPDRDHKTGKIIGYHKDKHFRTICTSQTTSTAQWIKYAGVIRRLTPTECFLLMGMNKTEASKLVDSGISDTQLYKLAGNSIVVDVLASVFGNLFKVKSKSEGLGAISNKKGKLSWTEFKKRFKYDDIFCTLSERDTKCLRYDHDDHHIDNRNLFKENFYWLKKTYPKLKVNGVAVNPMWSLENLLFVLAHKIALRDAISDCQQANLHINQRLSVKNKKH